MAGEVDPIEEALAEVIRSAASPAVQEAQLLLLRRLALEGSVLPSRIPVPRNITELGGYLNLLADAGQTDLRVSALASALGLASPSAIAWDATPPHPGMGQVANDLETAPAGGLPLTVPMRADFAEAWRTVVQPQLAKLGAVLPLWAPPARLPERGTNASTAGDVLRHLGRVVWAAPSAALVDPGADPVQLGRKGTDDSSVLRVMLRSSSENTAMVSWIALVWNDVGQKVQERDLSNQPLLAIEPLIVAAGFTANSSPSAPKSRNELAWGRLTNTAGLLAGATRLGDELRAVWSRREISQSAYADRLDTLWNGTSFA